MYIYPAWQRCHCTRQQRLCAMTSARIGHPTKIQREFTRNVYIYVGVYIYICTHMYISRLAAPLRYTPTKDTRYGRR